MPQNWLGLFSIVHRWTQTYLIVMRFPRPTGHLCFQRQNSGGWQLIKLQFPSWSANILLESYLNEKFTLAELKRKLGLCRSVQKQSPFPKDINSPKLTLVLLIGRMTINFPLAFFLLIIIIDGDCVWLLFGKQQTRFDPVAWTRAVNLEESVSFSVGPRDLQ